MILAPLRVLPKLEKCVSGIYMVGNGRTRGVPSHVVKLLCFPCDSGVHSIPFVRFHARRVWKDDRGNFCVYVEK